MTKRKKTNPWDDFTLDGSLDGTGDGARTPSGKHFIENLKKISLGLMKQVKEQRLTASKSHGPSPRQTLSHGGPRPAPGPSPYSPFEGYDGISDDDE